MKVGIFTGGETDARVIEARTAFAQGVDFCGVTPEYYLAKDGKMQTPELDVAVIWGITSRRFIDRTWYRDVVRASYPHVICIERGFVKRDIYYSAGWGGTAGLGKYCNQHSPADRWQKLGVELKPLKDGKSQRILIFGQVPWDTSVQDCSDYDSWLDQTVSVIREEYSCENVRLRSHPQISTPARSLDEDLEWADCAIAWSSTGLVDANIAGLRTIAVSPRSMAWQDKHISRDQWAFNLAYTQWSIDEMRMGLAWEHLVKGII